MNLRYLDGMTTLSYDQSRCMGCGRCTQVCPHGVFTLIEKRATVIDRDACIECGACMKNCPFNAIHVDAGVGCAMAIISSRGKKKSQGDCCDSGNSGCC